MAERKRRSELQWLNLIFCAMVIFVHCASAPVTGLERSSWQFAVTYIPHLLFHVSVCGFFLVSGIKLTLPRAKEPSLGQYWRGRAKNILLPYGVAVMAYYLWFVYVRHYFPFSWGEFFGYLLRGDLGAHFYFVITLAQFILLTPLFRRISRQYSPHLLLPIAFCITWFSTQNLAELLQVLFPDSPVFIYGDRVFTTYLFYYLAGCFIGRNYDGFLALLKKNRGLIIGSFLLFGGVYAGFALQNARGTYISFLFPLSQLYYLSAIPFCFLAVSLWNRPLPRLLEAADRASYPIYLYHILFLLFYDYLAERWLPSARIGTLFLGRLLFVFLLTPLFAVLWQSGVRKLKVLYRKNIRRNEQ